MSTLPPAVRSLLPSIPDGETLRAFWPGRCFFDGKSGKDGEASLFLFVEREDFPTLSPGEWEKKWEVREIAMTWKHPALLPLVDLRFNQDAAVLEYRGFSKTEALEHQSLAATLAAQPDRRLPEEEARDAIAQIMEAFVPVHQQGLVHRFLHPAFVFPAPGVDAPLLRVSHTGLSFLCSDPLSMALPGGDSLMDFAAPELIDAPSLPDHPRLDVYGLGALLWWLIFGERPPPHSQLQGLLQEDTLVHCGVSLSDKSLALFRHLLTEIPEERPRDARAALKLLHNPETSTPPSFQRKVEPSKKTESYRRFTPLPFAPTKSFKDERMQTALPQLFDTFPDLTAQMQEQLQETMEMELGPLPPSKREEHAWKEEFLSTVEEEIPFASEFEEACYIDQGSAAREQAPPASGQNVAEPSSGKEKSITPFLITSETLLPEGIPLEWEQEALEEDASLFTQPRKRLASVTKLWVLLVAVAFLFAALFLFQSFGR